MKPRLPLTCAFCASVIAAVAVPARAADEPAPPPPPAGESVPGKLTGPVEAPPLAGGPAAPGEAGPGAPAPAVPPPGGPAPAGTQITVGGITITGQEFTTDETTGQVIVTGSPRAIGGDEEVRANRLIYNRESGQVTAEGNVYLRQGTNEQRATRATYNFLTQEGRAEDVFAIFKYYYGRAEELLIHQGPWYQARNSRFTTCDHRNPHYEIHPRVLDIYPQERMLGRHTGIDFLGTRLLTVPQFAKSLQPRPGGESTIPGFGYDRRFGAYVEEDFNLLHKRPVWVDANARLNSSHEPSGGLLAATPGRLSAVGTLYYRDFADSQRIRDLQVSRLPEVGLVWTGGERPRPGHFLPHQVTGVRRPEHLDVSREWRFSGMLSGGYFRQHSGGDSDRPNSESKNGARINLQAQAIQPQVRLGPISLNDLRFFARQSFYDDGEQYSVLGTGIGKEWRPTRHLKLRVDRFDQWVSGESSFQFDRVELRQEWRPQVEYTTRQFSFSYAARIRGKNGNLFDQEISVAKLFHCIEPRVTYRVRRSAFFLEIGIPGLSGRAKKGVDRPRSEDTGDRGELVPEQVPPTAPKGPLAPPLGPE